MPDPGLTNLEYWIAVALVASSVAGWTWMALLLRRALRHLLGRVRPGRAMLLAWHRLFPTLEREWPNGHCALCGVARPAAFGHDPCIADLPGVAFACCGHGVEPGYVKFTDGRVIRGYFEARSGQDDSFPEFTHFKAQRNRARLQRTPGRSCTDEGETAGHSHAPERGGDA